MIQLVILVLLGLRQSNSSVFPIPSRPNNPQIPNRYMISYSPNENHIVSISTSNPTQNSGNQFHFMYIDYTYGNYSYTTIQLPYNAVLARSNHENYNDPNVANRRFLILDEMRTVVRVYDSVGVVGSFGAGGVGMEVVDLCLETNRDEFYTLERSSTPGDPYVLGYHLISSSWSRRINITQKYDPTQNPVMKCLRQSLFINFTDRIRVYSLNQSLWNIKTIKNRGNLFYMHAFGQMLSVRNTTHIMLFNTTTNYSLTKSIVMDPGYFYYCSLYFGTNTYLMILRQAVGASVPSIAQYDLRIDTIIFQFTCQIPANHMQMVHNHIFYYTSSPSYTPTARTSYLDTFHPSFNGTQCHQNYSYQSYSNYAGTFLTGCLHNTYNLNNQGGYSSTNAAGVMGGYLGVEMWNVFNDFNNFDGCCVFNVSFTIVAPYVYSYCLETDNYVQCIQFCEYQCEECDVSLSQCELCKNLYSVKDQDGCSLPTNLQIAVSVVASLYVLNTRTWQELFYFIDNTKFHNYHNVSYRGLFKSSLEFADAIQKNIWCLLQLRSVINWVQTPYPIPSYSFYTNQKFQKVERSDSFFLQATKDFFIIDIPIILISSFLLNRMFFLLFNYRVSIFFRLYSLWMNIIYLIVVQNLSMLVFLACHHFSHLFCYNFVTRSLQAVVVVILGLIFLTAISFYFLCQLFCKKDSKIFLVSITKKKGAFPIMFTRYITKPILIATIHSIFFPQPSTLLLLLSLSQLLSFTFTCIVQILHPIFKDKIQLTCDNILCGLFSLLNFLLYLQYLAGYSEEVSQLVRGCVDVVLYCIAGNVGLGVLVSVVKSLKLKQMEQNEKIKGCSQGQRKHETDFKKEKVILIKCQTPIDFKFSHDLSKKNRRNQSTRNPKVSKVRRVKIKQVIRA